MLSPSLRTASPTILVRLQHGFIVSLFVLLSGAAVAQSPSWTSKDKLALTYYFYWYNEETGVNVKNPSGGDGLTLHPPDSYLSTYAWTDVAFHQRELSDMVAAGIDVALPVYWGDPGSVALWSVPGLKAMVQAEQAMAQAGQAAPRIGMFHDISSLQIKNGGVPPDLTTAAGKSLFYDDIHNFFTIVPKQFWATIDGQPIVVLYLSAFVSAYDQTTFDYIAQRFQQDFGTTPYVIRQSGWSGVKTASVYGGWSGGGFGPKFLGDTASVTPGLDNLAVTYMAQEQGLQIVDRNCGDPYQQQWSQVISHGARLVLIETWNELFEATGVSATKEYGRQYIDLTAKNIAGWKNSVPSAAALPSFVSMSPGPQRYESGLSVPLNFPDGQWLTAGVAGHDAIYSHSDADSSLHSYYIYLAVDDRFLSTTPAGVWVTVEYLDAGNAPWRLEYDGATNPYTATAPVLIQGSGQWKTQTFYLPDAIFQKRVALGDADLRIDDYNPQGIVHYFGRVWITKSAPSGQPPQMPLLSDVVVAPGGIVDIPVSASDSAGNPLPVTLATDASFASLQGKTGAQVLHLAPSFTDVRSCAVAVTPGIASSPSYFITSVANDPNSPLPSVATTVQVSVSLSPGLNLSAPALALTAPTGSATAISKTLTISNTAGTAFLAGTSIVTQSTGGWLQWSQGSSAVAGTVNLQVSANPAGLGTGTYLGTITIKAPAGFVPPVQIVPVTLTVAAPGVLTVSSQNVVFGTLLGQDPASQSLTISNTGPTGRAINWGASVTTVAGSGWLSVNPSSGTNNGTVQIVVHAASLAAGSYSGTITITSAGAQNSPTIVAVTLNVNAAPVVQAIVDSWGYTSGIAPGTWVTIGGINMAAGSPQTWNLTGAQQLPTTVGGVTVTFDGTAAAVYYVSATQINALVPASIKSGPVQVVVQANGVSSNPFTITATATQPAVYSPPNADGSTFFVTAALQGTGFLVGNSATDPRVVRAAQPGDILDLYMIGLGATADASKFVTNQPFAGAYPVSAAVTATVGGEPAPVIFAGLTSPGLYLVRVAIPSDLAAGPLPIQISAGGVKTRSSLVLMVSAAPANLLQNGSLESAFTGNWQFSVNTSQGGAATLQRTTSTSVDGTYSAQISVTAAGTSYTAVQFWQGGIPIQLGRVYTLQFWAKADTPRTMQMSVTQNGGSFPSYGLNYPAFALSGDWQPYVFYFQATATDPAARLNLYFGSQAGNAWLDNILLR